MPVLLLVYPSIFFFEILKSVTISIDCSGAAAMEKNIGELARCQLLRWIGWMASFSLWRKKKLIPGEEGVMTPPGHSA